MALLDSLRRVFHKTVTLRHPRAHPRVMISEPIRVRTEWANEQQAILEDISVGGACVRTHVRMRPGDTIGLLMSLGVGRRFDARARVVYALPQSSGYQARYGLRFVGLPERDQSEINHFIVEQKFGRQFGMRPMQSSFERSENNF
ncbi:MAG TPA: PilZ domain-containing protein [Candidatus Eremiobacteraceae bacterium]|nr:PilZ domain-containing protein [Candidatus Eremiobacteraceae bacterium]